MSERSSAFQMVKFESLDETAQNLLKKAVEARQFAYAPYSSFKVGASLLCQDGTIFKGCNVENAAHASICAERTAYVKAVSEGKSKFIAVAIIAFQEKYITPPCGVCRQFMSEFGNVTVYMAKPSLEEVCLSSLDNLFPYQFQHNSDFTY